MTLAVDWVEGGDVDQKGMKIRRLRFSKAEDDLLVKLVSKYGTSDWNIIGEAMPTRNARQCRERYLNYACPTLRKGGWSRIEDEKLLSLCKTHGAKWSVISKEFVNRSDIELRNRMALLRRVGVSDSLYEAKSDGKVSDKQRRLEQEQKQEQKRKSEENEAMVMKAIDESLQAAMNERYDDDDLGLF